MKTTRIIGIILMLIGIGLLIVFSGETLGFIVPPIIIVVGLILTFLNRRGEI